MKKVRIIPIIRKDLIKIQLGLFLCIVLVAVNVLYFSQKADPLPTSTSTDPKATAGTPSTGKLAIIIDGFCDQNVSAGEIFPVEQPLTYAVSTSSATAEILAENAINAGHEVILHLPIKQNEALSAASSEASETLVSANDIRNASNDIINTMPYASGLIVSAQDKPVHGEFIYTSISDLLEEKDMCFVNNSSFVETNSSHGVELKKSSYIESNLYLKNLESVQNTKEQLKKAGMLAKSSGSAVIVINAGDENHTIASSAISELIPYFDEQNIKLVLVSELG